MLFAALICPRNEQLRVCWAAAKRPRFVFWGSRVLRWLARTSVWANRRQFLPRRLPLLSFSFGPIASQRAFCPIRAKKNFSFTVLFAIPLAPSWSCPPAGHCLHVPPFSQTGGVPAREPQEGPKFPQTVEWYWSREARPLWGSLGTMLGEVSAAG